MHDVQILNHAVLCPGDPEGPWTTPRALGETRRGGRGTPGGPTRPRTDNGGDPAGTPRGHKRTPSRPRQHPEQTPGQPGRACAPIAISVGRGARGQLGDNYGTTMGQPMGQPMGQLILLSKSDEIVRGGENSIK